MRRLVPVSELRVTDRYRMTSSAAPATKLPPELVSDWQALESRWIDGPLSEWRALLPEQFNTGLSPARYGDLPRWREAIANLPPLPTAGIQLNAARVGISGSVPTETLDTFCLLYTSPSPRDQRGSRMPSSA